MDDKTFSRKKKIPEKKKKKTYFFFFGEKKIFGIFLLIRLHVHILDML